MIGLPDWPQAAVSALPPLQRQVFLLRVRDGLALTAVAARTRLQPAEAGALLVMACRRVAPAGAATRPLQATGCGWLLEARERLQADAARTTPQTGTGPAAATPAPAAAGSSRSHLPWLLAGLLAGATAAGWWLWRPAAGPAPEPAAPPAQVPPAVELGPADTALAAPDLALLQHEGSDRERLEQFEFFRWLVAELAPELAEALPATPEEPAPGPGARSLDWEALPPAERATLVGWSPQWPHLVAAQRALLAENARLWAGLEAPAQARLLQRLEQWQGLPAAARAALRLRFEALQLLPAAEQAAMRAAQARFAALPEARRHALQSAFEALPASTREALLLPPAHRDVAALAQQVFSFVPADERAQTLAMVAALSDGGRERLRARVARMAPWQRDALRRELLAVPPEQRAGLLQQPP